MARLLVGPASPQGDIRKIPERFDLTEVRSPDGHWPTDATLRRWRKSVPPGFVFSVVLPRDVAAFAPSADAKLDEALHVAALLEARCVLLQTPADVRPTSANKKRIAALFQRIPAEGTVRCWEASGIWEPEDQIATARAARVLAVVDATQAQPAPGPIVYTRLRALAKGLSSGRPMERLAAALRGRREAFVVVEDPAEAALVRAALPAALTRARAATGVTVVRPQVSPVLVAEDEEQ